MAKKKNKKKGQSQQFMSPDKFLKERMRSVPVGKCYVTDTYEQTGFGNVIVTRVHTGGRISYAVFMTDFWCLGVKDCLYHLRVDDYEFADEVLGRFELLGLKEISYEEAHNLIYGAVAFAEEAGISPCKEFALAQYFLEEDTDDIPLIEYNFGKDGKYLLAARSQLELSTYLPILKKNLKEDQYTFMVQEEDDDWDDEDEGWDYPLTKMYEEDSEYYKYNGYPYTYKHKNLPTSLQLKHPRVLEIMQDEKNWLTIPKEQLDEILAFPHEELRQDLEQIILYGIHSIIDENSQCNSDEKQLELLSCPLFHSVMLLAEVGNDTSSLNVVLEVLRMPDDAIFDVFGDGIDMMGTPTIIKLGRHAISTLLSYLMEEGVVNSWKAHVLSALANIAYYYPETKDEVMAAYRTFLERALQEKQDARFTDYSLNGMLMCDLVYIHAKEFLPEIEKLYELELVDPWGAGKLEEVKRDLLSSSSRLRPYNLDLEKRYKALESAFG